ncbi:carboxy-S-adenosyl-L-methionine synthase CmoA [Helicobacter sp. 11S02596-1]|uniref:carboxy-S-adenosyl-L-methionine synthase CmoA n=1 Tax=Helicobacter sp. 11S02596-1 TaxID=1476194 RepID=UPI000BA7564C|nr:carboxy-S-adenosyl-L-methionine synthase CmoA [Helicobacter sp. 11S02596-1]PAF41913.1 carboxy-S-adenosyl-L-methionine synthase CmoA [Helicobacter sp. 11S02596-1]
MKKDELFCTPLQKQFEFDAGVASVFDDMAMRSIPYYTESLKLCADFVLQAIIRDTCVYDLGCSTGNFLLELASRLNGAQNSEPNNNANGVRLIGIDSSKAMIERASLKANTYGKNIDFICDDFLSLNIQNASAVIANYTMQFVRPMQRSALVEKIFAGLCDGGVFVMSEKMASCDKVLDKQMIARYYLYKKEQGYSQNEITTKREALENVLIPYSLQENYQMLQNAGFQSVEVLFKWVNFGTLIARKA